MPLNVEQARNAALLTVPKADDSINLNTQTHLFKEHKSKTVMQESPTFRTRASLTSKWHFQRDETTAEVSPALSSLESSGSYANEKSSMDTTTEEVQTESMYDLTTSDNNSSASSRDVFTTNPLPSAGGVSSGSDPTFSSAGGLAMSSSDSSVSQIGKKKDFVKTAFNIKLSLGSSAADGACSDVD